jgi:hypothetical protein
MSDLLVLVVSVHLRKLNRCFTIALKLYNLSGIYRSPKRSRRTFLRRLRNRYFLIAQENIKVLFGALSSEMELLLTTTHRFLKYINEGYS